MISLKNRNILTKDELNHYVKDEEIYNFYVGEFKDNIKFKSPFRPTEDDGSFKISYYYNAWLWVDYGRNNTPKNCVFLIMELYNLSYNNALNKIYEDIYLNNGNLEIAKINIEIKNKHSYSSCIIRDFYYDYELNYWKQANITEEDLRHYKIYCGEIRHNGIVWHRSSKEDPLFIYMYNRNNKIYKGYRPLTKDKDFKFYGYNVADHIQGYDLLPKKGEILIITKSYKDMIIWNKLGYPSIAPHAENMFVSLEMLQELSTRFTYIYVNYDNDTTGVENCIKYTTKYKEYNLNYFNIAKEHDVKDPFAFVCKYGYEELHNLFKDKLKRDKIILNFII